ncbi:MAG TPA: PepSY domain-containing protein [Maritimibacter sp.]|nr:PepSY domain-containing protein [Maritimibacter sp.]
MLKPILAIAALATLPVGLALADDDDRAFRGSLKDIAPRSEVMSLAAANGWSVEEIEMDDGYYEVEGRTKEGREIEVKLHPVTLQIMAQEYEDDDDDDGYGMANNPAPAGSAEPPKNGLFAPNAAPRVQVK